MFHYSIFFSKETEGELVSLPFCFECVMPLPAADVRREWITALTHPRASWLWPSSLSLPHVEEPPLGTGGFFRLAYQMPDPANLAAGSKAYEYDYSIVRWEPGEPTVFQYQAENGNGRRHPFMGGGTVTISPIDAGSTRFQWKGAYLHRGNRQAAEDVFAHYFSLFFTTMAKNVRLHFASQACTASSSTAGS